MKTAARRSGSVNPIGGRRKKALTAVNTAVTAPMPKPSDSVVMMKASGERRSDRSA